jgi:hypothetical protein
MSRRSWAIWNITGADRLTATVWPRSTLRWMTTPLTGARMTVRSRSICAWASVASRMRTDASALAMPASAAPIAARCAASWARVALSDASAASASLTALSISRWEKTPRPESDVFRSRSRAASWAWTWARWVLASATASAARTLTRSARALASAARATSSSADACCRRASKVCGSIRASGSSFLTSVLKSAYISLIWPDNCELTWTVTTAASVPEAEIAATTSPSSTFWVRKVGSDPWPGLAK